MALPTITATGNLAADPELRSTANGTAVATFTVACNDNRKNDRGEWEQVGTTWLRCTAWQQRAELVAEQLTKGDTVTITGRLKQDDYEKDGAKHTAYQVDVIEVARPIRPGGSRRSGAAGRTGLSTSSEPWGGPSAPHTQQPPF
ncbi:single-stranded DNA-binding protein [Streptomyces noursei]|uniref:single-stranded DNA-binding protein n=1 Tax=Streptomyces noursei TaxID=1971 RepID=UPI00081D24DA|nr:single-strand binding protein [Streptomyces noursei ATCC 11455]MCZ0994365.1 single-stranded DNA-binding protein [Streptomyces noursei]